MPNPSIIDLSYYLMVRSPILSMHAFEKLQREHNKPKTIPDPARIPPITAADGITTPTINGIITFTISR